MAAASACSVPSVAAARAPIAGSMGYTRIQRLAARVSTPAISPGKADGEWSPDGSDFVFIAIDSAPGPAAAIYSVEAGGNGVRRLIGGSDFKPEWSPDSRRIVFLRHWQGHTELFIVRSDGSGVTQLTDDGADKDGPRWRPY